MPKSGIAGSYGGPIFSFLRNLHIVLHSNCTNLHSHKQCRWGNSYFSPEGLEAFKYQIHHLHMEAGREVEILINSSILLNFTDLNMFKL